MTTPGSIRTGSSVGRSNAGYVLNKFATKLNEKI